MHLHIFVFHSTLSSLSFCVPEMKDSHTGLERHECEWINFNFKNVMTEESSKALVNVNAMNEKANQNNNLQPDRWTALQTWHLKWTDRATQTGFPMSSCESMCVCMRVYEYVGDSQWFWDNIKSSKTVKCQIGNNHLFKLFYIKYTTIQRFWAIQKEMTTFSRDALNWSKVTVKTFIIQMISISNKCSTFVFSTDNINVSWAANQHM